MNKEQKRKEQKMLLIGSILYALVTLGCIGVCVVIITVLKAHLMAM